MPSLYYDSVLNGYEATSRLKRILLAPAGIFLLERIFIRLIEKYKMINKFKIYLKSVRVR